MERLWCSNRPNHPPIPETGHTVREQALHVFPGTLDLHPRTPFTDLRTLDDRLQALFIRKTLLVGRPRVPVGRARVLRVSQLGQTASAKHPFSRAKRPRTTGKDLRTTFKHPRAICNRLFPPSKRPRAACKSCRTNLERAFPAAVSCRAVSDRVMVHRPRRGGCVAARQS